jgi:RNA polymerase sigma factor (TIGR02999 family)
MRQILIDHARSRNADKRGGDWQRISFAGAPGPDDGLGQLDVLALDEALKSLAKVDPRQSRVVELRFFSGLSVDEVAEVLAVSPRTVELDWKMAKAWLSRALSET